MTVYHYDQGNTPENVSFHSPVMTGEVQRSILEAYLWMFGGLGLTGLTAFAFYHFGWLYAMLETMPMLMVVLPVVQIVLAFVFSFAMNKASVGVLRILFGVYAFTLGISLSSVLAVYTDTTIYLAFFICALYFGCLCIIGATTKKDLTKIGTIAIAALLALIISQVVMMFLRVSMDTRLFSVIGLLIFTGITAYDVQRLNTTMLYSQGQPVAQKKWAIFFALQMYLDFINIFLYILQLLGSHSSNRR